MLWDVGVDTFDVSCGETFRLHAALMWTINDFPAYGMLSGWSTHGLLACPVCMHQNCAFQTAWPKAILVRLPSPVLVSQSLF